MQDSNARTLRGVSIAVVVLAILAIVVFLLGTIAVGAVGAFASDPTLYGDGIAIDGYRHGYHDSLSPEAAAGLVGASLGIATAFLVWGLLCAVVTLIAGILGLRNHDKPEKLGSVFGWSIVGAVLAFLSGRIITTVLLVVAAVYSSKLRNGANAPYGYGQSAYGQPVYAQPGYPQPAPQPQPYGQQPYPQPEPYQQSPMAPMQQAQQPAPQPTQPQAQQPMQPAPQADQPAPQQQPQPTDTDQPDRSEPFAPNDQR